MKRTILLLSIIISNTLIYAQQKILFDNTKDEQAKNADWIIDDDGQIPYPAQSEITESTTEDYWQGALSSWGVEMVKQGFWVETLPTSGSITYGDEGNTQDLSNYDIYVLCEPNNPFTTDEKDAILNFVSNGGGLFMIADHPIADRDGDGWAAVHVFNDLMDGNPFGIQFSTTDDLDEVPSLNIANLPGDPLLHGIKGDVAGIEFHGGASMIINPSDNATVKAVIYQNGFSNTGTIGVMAAYASYGNGRVVGIGDSSVAEDETASDNSNTWPGWIQPIGGVADGDDGTLVTNATIWLAGETIILPEPSNNVTNFTVSETTNSSISLTWADANAGQLPDAYLIKAVINPASITDPSDGIAEPNSIIEKNVIYGTESVVFDDLIHSTIYDFKIFPYTNSGSNIDYLTSSVPAVQGLTLLGPDVINSEKFSDCENATWFSFNVEGLTDTWDCLSGYQDINGYGDEADEDWLIILNPINFDNYSDEEFTFKTDESYDGPDLELYYSIDYLGTGDPNLSNWTPISNTFNDISSDENFSGWNNNTVDLSELSGTLYIGFKYTADGTGGGSEYWRVDDIKITGYSYSSTPQVSVSNTPSCSSGTITVSSNLAGVQTFYLFNSDGSVEIDNSGVVDATSYSFIEQPEGTYTGKVDKEGNLSAISNSTTLTNLTETIINSQPSSIETNVGGNVDLSVVAEGNNLTYQWRFNNSDIIGAESNTYSLTDVQISDAGNYDVVVTSECGEVISDIAVLTVSSSIENIEKYGINIYPNPSNGKFNIKFNKAVNEVKITISDMTGKDIYYEILGASSKPEIKLESFTKGIYFIKFNIKDKTLISKLIID